MEFIEKLKNGIGKANDAIDQVQGITQYPVVKNFLNGELPAVVISRQTIVELSIGIMAAIGIPAIVIFVLYALYKK